MERIEAIFERFHMDPSLLYDAIVRSTDDYIYIADMKTDEALVSENMVRDFELPGRLFNGLVPTWGKLVHDRDRLMYFDSIERMVAGETNEHNAEYQVRNRRGEYVWVLCRGMLKRNEAGEPVLFAGTVSNLGNKGKVDHTTGLFTQTECEKMVQGLTELRGMAMSGGILLLGLDNFTHINNLNNHVFGDMVLRSFAQTVQGYLSDEAVMFRFDGDQFAVVFPRASEDMLLSLYRKIHIYYNQSHTMDEVSYYCTASAGIAMLGRDADNYLDLMKYAASALSYSKENGKNICTVFSPELIQARLRVQELENQLQISVAEEMRGFWLVYQPIIDTESFRVHEAEVLLRWSCDRLGSVPPGEFVPILESTGLITHVGRWILEQAVKTCREWVEKDDRFLMNINVSYLQLLEPEFVPFLVELLERYRLASRHILLEMTESYFVTDMGTMRNTVQMLRDMGILIAMDDFGTGYSSLGMLVNMPADVIKIDRAFISMIDRNRFNQTFIGSVIGLCHSVGIRVCVEGTERNEEVEAVCKLDADSIQGFYFSRPALKETFGREFLGCGRLRE